MASRDHPLECYRGYLHALARLRLGPWYRAGIDPSDVVHQAMLKAYQHRGQFRGQTEAEWRAYLRKILANAAADALRALAQEAAIRQGLDESSARLEAWVAAEQSSPSQRAQREEQLLRLADALARLSEDERTALELRYFQDPPWPLADIARRLGRPTPKAVAGLLARGLDKLRRHLRDDP